MFDHENPIELVGTVQEVQVYQPAHLHLVEGEGRGRKLDSLEYRGREPQLSGARRMVEQGSQARR
jgi:hypothetical protein